MDGDDDTNIFGEEVNSILREDSVVRQMRPFLNELITLPAPMQQHRHEMNDQQQGYVTVLNGVIHPSHQVLNHNNLNGSQTNYYEQHQHHQLRHPHARLPDPPQMQHPANAWDGLGHENYGTSHYSYGEDESRDSFISNTDHQHSSHLHLRPQDQQFHSSTIPCNTLASENDASSVPNSSSVMQVPPNHEPAPPPSIAPSLQPWNGLHNFKISLATDNKDRNKWCYSAAAGKLYLCPLIAVPVDISVQGKCDAHIRITPIYTQSQHRMDSVTRCYNCKSKGGCDASLVEHIVQVEGEECQYEVIQDRYVVTVPLSPPPPGEKSTTLFIKMMCLTSCVGGPNRRPFCLVFTLICKSTGREIGRQILEVKCCKCPLRDMNNEDRSSTRSENIVNNRATTVDEKQTDKIRELASQIKVGQKRKKPSMTFEYVTKSEPEADDAFVNVAVPAKYVRQVKRYINGLIAADILKRSQTHILLYPESEGDE